MTRPNRKRSDSPSKIATAWKACGGLVTKSSAAVASGWVGFKCMQAAFLPVLDKALSGKQHVGTQEGVIVVAALALSVACMGLILSAGSELRACATAPKHPTQYKKYYQNPTLRR